MTSNSEFIEKKLEISKNIKFLILIMCLGVIIIGANCFLRYNIVGNMDLLFKNINGENIHTESGQYQGNFMSLFRDEHDGQFLFNCGDSYDGQWENMEFEGVGTYIYTGIGTYTGEFKDGKRHGYGKFVWNNGAVYEGGWDSDAIYCDGKLTTSHGEVLNGAFEGNAFKNGTLELKKGNATYVFDIINGALDTYGTVEASFHDGTKYSGSFSKSGLDGEGTITYKGGDEYTGEVLNGKKHGEGEYTWNDGSSYKGSWSNDKMHGQGVYSGDGDTTFELSGKFDNGKPTGKCTYKQGEDKYYTTWKNGKCTKVEGVK